MTLGNHNRTDGQTDRRTDRVRRNMRGPLLADPRTRHPRQISLNRCNESPLWGENAVIRPLE